MHHLCYLHPQFTTKIVLSSQLVVLPKRCQLKNVEYGWPSVGVREHRCNAQLEAEQGLGRVTALCSSSPVRPTLLQLTSKTR